MARPLLLALALWATPAAAQAPAVTLPVVPTSARIAGLGGADVAMIGYAGSIFDNPAGLAPIRLLSLEATYTRFDETSRYFMGAVAARAGPVNVGAGTRYLRFEEDQPLRDNLEMVGAVTLRTRGVALGMSLDYVSVEDSGGTTFRTMTGDAALTVAFFDIAALAVSFQNVARAALSGPALEVRPGTSVGFSLNLIDTYSHGRLLATVQRSWSEGGRTHFGVEGGAVFYGVGIVARAGTSPIPPGSPFNRAAFGGSVVLPRGALDYAYLDRPGRGPLHVVGLRWTP
jgi:hypothetical protein